VPDTKTATGSVVTTAPAVPAETTAETHREAVAEFFREQYQPLFRDVLYLGATRAEAEDAVSAAMSDVLVKWPTIRHPRTWARRAAAHHFMKQRKRDRERRQKEADPGAPRPAATGGEAELSQREDLEWVAQLLGELPPAQREVMALLVDDHSQVEIAEILGKTPAAVRQNLAAARRSLKQEVLAPTNPEVSDHEVPDNSPTTTGSEVR
jgi:RNA polymerase sigma factor (sigma-70 family)